MQSYVGTTTARSTPAAPTTPPAVHSSSVPVKPAEEDRIAPVVSVMLYTAMFFYDVNFRVLRGPRSNSHQAG